MFLQLGHTKLEVYACTRDMVLETYKISKLFPPDERFALIQQIRRAATSVHLNLAEGCSRKSIKERNRFFEISRGSLIEVDTVIDIALKLQYLKLEETNILGTLIIKSFKLLSGMIKHE